MIWLKRLFSAALRFNCPSTIRRVPSRRLGDQPRAPAATREPPVRVVTGRMLEQLTYAQIGERLNVSPEAARAIVKRNRLPRSHGNDGRASVAIDLDELRHKPMPARSPRGQPVTDVVAALKVRIQQLEAELAAEQQRSAGQRVDYERERERADHLVTVHDKLVIQLQNLRMLLQAARRPARPVTARTLREWWRWLRTTG